jgi:hypothetical protein
LKLSWHFLTGEKKSELLIIKSFLDVLGKKEIVAVVIDVLLIQVECPKKAGILPGCPCRSYMGCNDLVPITPLWFCQHTPHTIDILPLPAIVMSSNYFCFLASLFLWASFTAVLWFQQ